MTDLYGFSVVPYTQGLAALSGFLAKAAGHAEEKALDPKVLLAARLFPDMFP